MKQLAWLVIAMTALAGCTGDDDDGGPKCTETQYEDASGNCLPHVEPSIRLEGMPDTLTQFFSAEFTWVLDNGTRGMDEVVHSMDSRIKADMNATTATNMTGPEDWGTEVARENHKNLPDQFTASISWDEPGTLYLKGYMQIDGENVWTDLGSITVNAVTATGNRTTVTISEGAPTLSESETTVTVGDGVTFSNENQAIAYTLTFTGDDCPSGGSIAAGASLDVDFLTPGSCPYDLTTAASDNSDGALNQGDLDGKITVGRP